MKLPIVGSCLLAGGLLLGCGGEKSASEATAPSSESAAAAVPAGLFLTAAPEGAKSIAEAKPSLKAGDTVVLAGYIGGRREPFTTGRAIFVMADEVEAPACTDGCPIAWDACCTPSDVIARNSATIQLVDEKGAPLRLNLQGTNGLEPGTLLTVVGTVRTKAETALVVDATGLYRRTP
jgi:hypothetical protein